MSQISNFHGRLAGATVKEARRLSEQERDELYPLLSAKDSAMIMEFSNGCAVVPLADPEGNGFGWADLLIPPNEDEDRGTTHLSTADNSVLLERVLEDALEQLEHEDRSPTQVAREVASEYANLWSNNPAVGAPEPDNLSVLAELREQDALCTDKLDHYSRWAPSTDPNDATIEAIVKRSLEEYLHDQLCSHHEPEQA